jgi:hypothetical protein
MADNCGRFPRQSEYHRSHIVGQVGHRDSLKGAGTRPDPSRFEHEGAEPIGCQTAGQVGKVVSPSPEGGNQDDGGALPVDVDLEWTFGASDNCSVTHRVIDLHRRRSTKHCKWDWTGHSRVHFTA